MSIDLENYEDSNGLTSKQEGFAQSVVYGKLNYTDAYKANYDCEKMKDSSIHVNASQLANNTKVALRISELRARIQAENDATHEKITQHLSAIAFGTIKDLYDKHGKLIHPSKMTSAQSAMLKKFDETLIDGVDADGNEVSGVLTKIELQDALKALDMLARHTGYYEKDHEQAVGMTRAWEELEEIHQELMQEMRDDEARLKDRGVDIALALSEGVSVEEIRTRKLTENC